MTYNKRTRRTVTEKGIRIQGSLTRGHKKIKGLNKFVSIESHVQTLFPNNPLSTFSRPNIYIQQVMISIYDKVRNLKLT